MRINLDHNATTTIDSQVRDAVVACLDAVHGNPSSVHAEGQQARRVVDAARAEVARLIHAAHEEILFTAGGTEADNLAILGSAEVLVRRRVLVSAIEHRAVLEPCRRLERRGWHVVTIPVDAEGRCDPAAVAAALGDDAALVSVMLANNDVGTIQPVAAIAAAAHARGALVHCDAVQAAGRLSIDVAALGVDLLSLSAHKCHGPKGVGALYVRRGTPLAPVLLGGRQERRLRAGTENVPAIAGFGTAARLAAMRLDGDAAQVRGLRDRFESLVLTGLPDACRNGPVDDRLPNTANLGFPGVDAARLVVALDLAGVAASTGAACSAGSDEPSYVLMAMGRDAVAARATIRFSFGRGNTADEVERAAAIVVQAVRRQRERG
jgi:cysteine desulfurase